MTTDFPAHPPSSPEPSITSPGSILTRLRASFAAAHTAGATEHVDLLVAGTRTRLHYADPVLRSVLTPSLRGMQTTTGTPTANIYAWTGHSTVFPCPGLLQALAAQPGLISAINIGNFHLQYNPTAGILSCIDSANGEAFYYVTSVDELPFYEICTPMRLIVNWLCRMSGALMVHAAVAGSGGKGALIIGRSGAGKSTTSLQCLLHGLEYLGDDYVALSDQGHITAHQLYRGCKVMDDALERLPALQAFVSISSGPGGKNVIMLDESLGRLRSQLVIVAIVRPRIAHARKTAFTAVRPLQAITEFAGSTILQMPGTADFMLRELSRICCRLPAYDMEMSRDPAEISATLSNFLVQQAAA